MMNIDEQCSVCSHQPMSVRRIEFLEKNVSRFGSMAKVKELEKTEVDRNLAWLTLAMECNRLRIAMRSHNDVIEHQNWNSYKCSEHFLTDSEQ